MTFDPMKHLIQIKGKDYLEVKWRVVWLRETHPDASVETEVVRNDSEGVTVRAEVSWPILLDGGHVHIVKGSGYAYEPQTRQGRMGQAMENAETSSIGRALATLGFGTQFAPEMDQGEGHVVDSPVQQPPPQRTESPRSHEPARVASDDPNAATDAQKRRIFAMGRAVKGWEPDQIKAYIQEKRNKTIDDLTKAEASALMDHWQAEVDAAEAARQ